MKNQEPKDIICKKIAWTIRNFSSLKTNNEYCSEVFTVGDFAWKVLIYRGRKDGMSLAIFLEVANASSMPQGWSIYADFTLTVVNQVAREKSVKSDLTHKFCANDADWGFPSFMALATLQDPSNGYILNDNCIVEVEFLVVRSEGIEPTSRPAYPSLLFKESDQFPSNPNDDDDVIDFKDFGQIEKSFVPLLEEVCSWHPSLMECKKNRSRRFTEWAFTALGRVLQFLKNKKWKDMNEEACEQLQYLWEELEISRLELSWLEPYVKSALNMKGYMEKVEKVKRLKENLVVLETEMELLKEQLADTEESVEIIKKDLVNAEEGFEENDLDAEIGYGNP